VQQRGAEEFRVDHEFRLDGLRNSASGKRHGLIRFVAFAVGRIFSCDCDVFYRSRRLVLTLVLRFPFENLFCHLVNDENQTRIPSLLRIQLHRFPKFACGIIAGHHGLSHSSQWENWSIYDAWLASHFAYLIDRLTNLEDEYGSVLDNTLLFYGSACSTTHNARNCPMILAGGKRMGLQHGSYHVIDDSVPISNLYLSMLQTLGVDSESFSDNTGKHETQVFA